VAWLYLDRWNEPKSRVRFVVYLSLNGLELLTYSMFMCLTSLKKGL
jgi:hypothetical protein